jgi:hypothetical protein
MGLTKYGEGTNVSSQQKTFAAGATISKGHPFLSCAPILDGQEGHLVIIVFKKKANYEIHGCIYQGLP